VDKVPVSEFGEELGLRPTVFYRWQKELFENGAAAFQSQPIWVRLFPRDRGLSSQGVGRNSAQDLIGEANLNAGSVRRGLRLVN
jgi:hypothetical protein